MAGAGWGADFAPDPAVVSRPQAIAADGRVGVPLLCPVVPDTNLTLEIELVAFRDPLSGETLPVTWSLPGLVDSPRADRHRLTVPAGRASLELVLHAPAPAHTNVFEGALRQRHNDGPWTRHPLSVRRRAVPRPAGVALDTHQLEASQVRPWWAVVRDWFPGRPVGMGRFTGRVREKSGGLPLLGLTVRQDRVPQAPAGGWSPAYGRTESRTPRPAAGWRPCCASARPSRRTTSRP